jgi:hypothetical protein
MKSVRLWLRLAFGCILIGFAFLCFPDGAACQDWGQKVQEAFAAAGNQDVIVDMTKMNGTQMSSVNPFSSLAGNANVVLKIGCYDVMTEVPWVIKAAHVRVEFCSPYSQLRPTASYRGGPLVTVGDNTFPIQDVLIEYGDLNCENMPKCTPYVGNGLNEFSGLRHTNLGNSENGGAAAIQINGTVVTNGHYILEDLQLSNVGANDCISVLSNEVNQERIKDITCNNALGTPVGKAGIHISANGTAQTEVVVEQIHAEGFHDGVFFDNGVLGSARDIDCTNGCTDAVRIGSSSCSDITLEAITVTSAPVLIQNNCVVGGSVVRPTGWYFRTLALYVQSNYEGSSHISYFTGLQWVTK